MCVTITPQAALHEKLSCYCDEGCLSVLWKTANLCRNTVFRAQAHIRGTERKWKGVQRSITFVYQGTWGARPHTA